MGVRTVRTTSLQWVAGILCATLGALIFVAPHQFDRPVYALLRHHLIEWGGLFLPAGLALLLVAGLPLSRQVLLLTHMVVCGALLVPSISSFQAGAWIGAVGYAMLGFGLLVAGVLPRPSIPSRSRPVDLLVMLIGLSFGLIGLLMLTYPDLSNGRIYASLQPLLGWYGSVFLASGLLLVVIEGWSTAPRWLVWLAYGLVTSVAIVFLLTTALPSRTWIGIAYFGGCSLILPLLPWLGPRLDQIDRSALRSRLAFTLAGTTAIALISATALSTAQQSRSAENTALAHQHSLVSVLARDLAYHPRVDQSMIVTAALAYVQEYEATVGFVVDLQGQLVAHSETGSGGQALSQVPPAVWQVLSRETSQSGTFTYQTPSGKQLVAYAHIAPWSQWVVIEQPASVALAAIQASHELTFGLLVIAIGLAAGLGNLLAGWLTASLTSLARAVDQLAGGSAALTIPRSSITEVRQLAGAVNDLWAHLAERTHEHNQAEARLRFLATASARLTASLDEKQTLATLAGLATAELADYCIVYQLAEDGTITRTERVHADPTQAAVLERLDAFPVDPQRLQRITAHLSRGQPIINLAIDDEWLAALASSPEHLTVLKALAPRTHVILPLRGRERLLGGLLLATTAGSQHSWGPAELALSEELAHRAALAIEHAYLYREAQRAVRLREDFLSIAAHELRTPLTTIKGYVQLLSRRVRPGRERVAIDGAALAMLAEQLTGQVGRLEQLVAELLDIARLQRDRTVLQRETLDLTALAGEVIERFQQAPDRLPSHHLRLVAPEPVSGRWDASRLDQALTNLLSNALKYSPDGGEIVVNVRLQGGVALLSVRDQGIGIAPADQAMLFQPFARIQAARQKVQGTGLGLYIVSQVVERHGGTIELVSQPGRGSTFSLYLPLTGQSTPAMESASDSHTAMATIRQPRRATAPRPATGITMATAARADDLGDPDRSYVDQAGSISAASEAAST